MDEKPRKSTRIVSYLIMLLLVILIPISLTAFNLSLTLFNANRVSAIVTEVVTESDLLPTLLAWYSQTRAAQRVVTELAIPEENEPDIVQMLVYPDIDDWRAARDLLLPTEWVAAAVQDVVGDLLLWLDSADRLPQVSIDLSAFKAHASSGGPDAVLIALESMPVCTPAQVADLEHRIDRAQAAQRLLRNCGIPDPWTESEQASFLTCAADDEPGLAALNELCTFPDPWSSDLAREYVECARIAETGEALYNLCQFDEPYRSDQRLDYEQSLQDVVADFPDSFDATAYLQSQGVQLVGGITPESIKQQLNTLRVAGYAAPLAIALLLFLLVLINRADRGRGLRWAGLTLVLGGLLGAAQAAGASPLVARSLLRFTGALLPPPVVAEVSLATGRILNSIFQPMLVQALLVVAAGALALALSIRRGTRSERESNEELENLETRTLPKAQRPEDRKS